MNILKIVEKLIGETYAIGETIHDLKANENIKVLGQLAYDLTKKLYEIRNDNFNAYAGSVKENGEIARQYIVYIQGLKEWLDE